MTQKIFVLPPDVANRIAAGEVVERPASVVKELVENSIDAASTEISIMVQAGGLREIQVIDNGVGMGRDDALRAFERYATSKIRAGDDLAAIRTLGFRGEALPSIASVSKVRMVTKEHDALSGIEILFEGGQVESVREAGCRTGTEVVVSDLFFNTPGRRKFQRSVGTEFSHVMDVIVRTGLAHPAIHFRLFHNEKKVLDLPATKDPMVRLGSLLGKEVWRAIHPVKVRIDYLSIDGYLGDPALTRSNPKGIYIYVNGRFVRDRTIHHGLLAGYRNLIPKDRYPVAVLFLHLPPWSVDVNVHPMKTEVRFGSGQLIHRGVMELARGLLPGASEQRGEGPVNHKEPHVPSLAVGEPPTAYEFARAEAPTGGSMKAEVSHGELAWSPPSSFHILGQIAKTYLVCESPRGLILIDQHAAHERILFQRLKRQMERGEPAGQGLLFAETVEVSPAEWETLKSYLSELNQLGFEMEPFGRNTLAIKSIPAVLSREDCSQVVLDLLRDLAAGGGKEEGDKRIDRVLKATACHGAIRSGQTLSNEEIAGLLHEMEEEGFFQTCPHGRPVWVAMDRHQLDRMFMRTS